MHKFHKLDYNSYHNSGEGDSRCIFKSVRQSLQLDDTVVHMQREMVRQLELAPESSRVSQLNEHIMLEIEAQNNIHFKSTTLPNICYLLISDLSSHQAVTTYSSNQALTIVSFSSYLTTLYHPPPPCL